MAAFSKQLLDSQAAFRNLEQTSCGGLLEGISRLVSDFKEAGRNFFLCFSQKTAKNCENHQHSYESTVFIFKTF
jgi:hypothetical protein